MQSIDASVRSEYTYEVKNNLALHSSLTDVLFTDLILDGTPPPDATQVFCILLLYH